MRPVRRPPRQIAAEFRALLAAGARLLPAGEARDAPRRLLTPRYLPRHAVTLFDATYYLTDFRFEEGLDFFVAYVALREPPEGRVREVHPRIFYKDLSLVWRVASHVVRSEEENWIGKGDVRCDRHDGVEDIVSDEDSTNLPYEIQGALDVISRRTPRRRDDDAVLLVLRNAPRHRIEPYADFTAPRRRAAAARAINRGRPVVRLTRRGDPASLRFAGGFEPDFAKGLVEVTMSASRLYGGTLRKYRILSANRQVQYQFVAAPGHVWVNSPQALTRELTTYGVRALHVPADDAIFIPGYEYHYEDDSVDPPELYTQIPTGFVGDVCPLDPERADASRWIEALPIIREFRKRMGVYSST